MASTANTGAPPLLAVNVDAHPSPTPVVSQTPGPHAAHCGVQILRTARGWRFSSLRGRFTDFTVTTSLVDWDGDEGVYRAQELVAHFPGAAARLRFDSQSVLLTYPSGHIRWIPSLGFRYYAILSRGAPPGYCQGDLVLFPLADHGFLAHRFRLSAMLPPDQSTIWCRSRSAGLPPGGETWVEADEVAVGGNTRHKAVGRLRFAMPIEGDRRSVQIYTLDRVRIQHDPVDEIHPTLHLPPGLHFLVTKLPGFSDPILEMKAGKEVIP